jgi:CDP-paratose 2-epimerase
LKNFTHYPIDIRNQDAVLEIFKRFGDNISLVVHTAAQPSHDWAAREPITDFTVNANGTLMLLEATRLYCPDATFIFTSTNKVYGDAPNQLPLVEHENRWEIDESHRYFEYGIDETMSIDQSKHSLFGVSKVAADVLVQEYGRYFDLKTGTFRGGCLTGPGHSGAELHGFLAYLAKCAVTNKPYTIYGYGGKQVRDNIHSYDLVNAFWHFYQNPRPAAVYNMGGSRQSNCSVLEAIEIIQELSGNLIRYEISDQARSGDHIWWISDIRRFQKDYPEWSYRYDLRGIVQEILDATVDRSASQRS